MNCSAPGKVLWLSCCQSTTPRLIQSEKARLVFWYSYCTDREGGDPLESQHQDLSVDHWLHFRHHFPKIIFLVFTARLEEKIVTKKRKENIYWFVTRKTLWKLLIYKWIISFECEFQFRIRYKRFPRSKGWFQSRLMNLSYLTSERGARRLLAWRWINTRVLFKPKFYSNI